MASVFNFADRVRPMTLNVASVPTLASDLGFMSTEGLDSKIVQCDGTPQALAALEKDEVQMAQVNIAPVVDWVAKCAPLRVVWGLVHGDPFKPPTNVTPDVGLILVSSPFFSKLDELKGARIGISAKGATNHHALIPLLRDHGVDPEKGVRWVEGGSTPSERMEQLLGGGIDAMVTTPQTLSLFEGRKEALRILASGKDFAKLAGVQFLVGVTREDLVAGKPQTVLSALKALIKASRDFGQNPRGWVEGAARRRPDVSKEVIMKAWEQSRGHWPVNGRLDPKTVQEATKRLKKSGEVSAVPSAAAKEWVDIRFIDAALGELGEWKE